MTADQERMIETIDAILERESRARRRRSAQAAQRLLSRLRQVAFADSGTGRGLAL